MRKRDIRRKDIEHAIELLIALELEHLVDDIRDAVKDNEDNLRFQGDKI